MGGSDEKSTVPLRDSSGSNADGTVTDPDRTPTLDAPVRVIGLPTIDPKLYDLGEEIAHGGMGRIRAARDLRLGRDVAIKEILELRGGVALRFEREAILTARLQHPSIVAVYEAGRWPTGEPFYAMRRVPGHSLRNVIAQRETYDERLALLPNVIAIADAMGYAHDQRIIHRDLKPANVLVGDFGETVVIDWGLAKDLTASTSEGIDEHERVSSADLTVAGSVVGTPNYMPPEQAAGQPVDERADVYAIGALLYHVLAGTPPYVGDNSRAIIAKVVAEPPPAITTHQKSIAPDLIAIVERAMARDLSRRYRTARELAEDLRRFQTGQLVASHQYTRRELVWRFARRHRTALGIAGVAALIVGVVGAISVQRIRRERDESVAQRARADRERATAQRERATAIERADVLTIEQAATAIERDRRAALQLLAGLSEGSPQWAAARVIAADAASKGIPRVLFRAPDRIDELALARDGKHLAIAGENHAVSIVDLASGASRVLGAHFDKVEQLELSADGRVLASSSADRTVKVWDLVSGAVTTLHHDNTINGIQVSAKGSYVVTVDFSERARLWDVASGIMKLDIVAGGDMGFLGGSGEEDTRVLYGGESGFHVVDIASGHARALASNAKEALANAAGVQSSTDKMHLAIGRQDGTVLTYDLESGHTRVLGKHGNGPIYSPKFTPDDSEIATLAVGELRLWPVDGRPARTVGVQPEVSVMGMLSMSPDGHALVSMNSSPRLWNLDTGESSVLVGPHGAESFQFTPDASRVIAKAADTIWSWPAHVGSTLVERHTGEVRSLAVIRGQLVTSDARAVQVGPVRIDVPQGITGRAAMSPAGTRAALLGADGRVHLLDLASRDDQMLPGTLAAKPREFPGDPTLLHSSVGPDGKAINTVVSVRRYVRNTRDHSGWFDPVVFSPDGTKLAAAGTTGGTVYIHTLAGGEPLVIELGATDIEQLAFSPDGRSLFAAASDGNVHVISVEGGAHRSLVHGAPVEAIVLSPDGRTLYTACVDRTMRAWDLSGDVVRVIGKHTDIAVALALTLDGSTLVSAAQGGQVTVWDVASGKSADLEGLVGQPLALALSPDGKSAVAADSEGVVRLWNLASRRGRTLRANGSATGAVAFSADGTQIYAASEDGSVNTWDDSLPTTEAGLRRWLAEALR